MESSMSWTFSWKGLRSPPASNLACNTYPSQVIARPAAFQNKQPSVVCINCGGSLRAETRKLEVLIPHTQVFPGTE